VALHEADLHDFAGAALGGDDALGVGERDAKRLLDKDVQPGVERCEHDGRMGRVRRGDQHRIQAALIEQTAVIGVHARHAVTRGERLADHAARIGERGELEPVPQFGQVREVHRLGDHPATDDADPDPPVPAHPVLTPLARSRILDIQTACLYSRKAA
jgi:hypothetical protein